MIYTVYFPGEKRAELNDNYIILNLKVGFLVDFSDYQQKSTPYFGLNTEIKFDNYRMLFDHLNLVSKFREYLSKYLVGKLKNSELDLIKCGKKLRKTFSIKISIYQKVLTQTCLTISSQLKNVSFVDENGSILTGVINGKFVTYHDEKSDENVYINLKQIIVTSVLE